MRPDLIGQRILHAVTIKSVFLIFSMLLVSHASALTPINEHVSVETGFPVQTLRTAGTYPGGQSLHILIDNFDVDPELEIILTGIATGPLFAWNYDGSPMAGWPVDNLFSVIFPVAAQLDNTTPHQEIVAGYFHENGATTSTRYWAYDTTGALLPGWPLTISGAFSSPPIAVDIDNDGIDELFSKYDGLIRAHNYLGQPLNNFTLAAGFDQIASADLDNDGDYEFISRSGSANVLNVIHHDGSQYSGFPITYTHWNVKNYYAIGDVDNDGNLEIVFTGKINSNPSDTVLYVVSNMGVIEQTIFIDEPTSYGTAPALADLDGDGAPEIIVQTNQSLNVFYGNGNVYPGWPVVFESFSTLDSASPVVGDIDGDALPDIVIVRGGGIYAYNRSGGLVSGFPVSVRDINGFINSVKGYMPAIADIDLDGINEIVVATAYWTGTSGWYDGLWVLQHQSSNHGAIQWPQYQGNSKHTGLYAGGANLPDLAILNINPTGTGEGNVQTNNTEIKCGLDCTQTYSIGDQVSIAANESLGSTFSGWSGDCQSQPNPCQLSMNTDKNIDALFDLNTSDIEVLITANNAIVTQGDQILFTATIRNTDTSSAGDVVFTQYMPNIISVQTVQTSHGACSYNTNTGNYQVVCQLGGLLPGESATVQTLVNSDNSGAFYNNNNVTSSSNDPDSSNDTASILVTIESPPPPNNTGGGNTNNTSSGGGCSINPNADPDPVLPGLLFLSILYFFRRRWLA